MPAASVRVALVAAHDADRAESDLLVGADGRDVIGGGIDRDAVMAAVVDEVSHDPADRLGAEAATVVGGIEEQVDTRVVAASKP